MAFSSRLYRSRKTILEMLYDRGYLEAAKLHQTQEEFEDWVETQKLETEKEAKENMTINLKSSNLGDVRVYWYTEKKLGTESRNLIRELQEDGIKKAIIVIEISVTAHAKITLKNLKAQGTTIDVFTVKETQYNITHNRLVPKHEICSYRELKKYAVSKDQLPGILVSDPVVKYLGANKGEIIKIFRESETMKGEKVIFYRLVCQSRKK